MNSTGMEIVSGDRRYTAQSQVDPLLQGSDLSEILDALQNANLTPPPQQKMVVAANLNVPYQQVVDRVIQLRPKIASMTWNGPYLSVARRIHQMTQQANYQPKPSSWVEECFACTLTAGCRERLLLEDAKMTQEQLSDWQFWTDFAQDPMPN